MRSAIGAGSTTPSRAAAKRRATMSPTRRSREGPAAGCPIDQPSPRRPGETRFNPVENYMDYSDDACMKHFTPQRFSALRDMAGYYRYKLSPQTSRSSLLEQIRQEHRARYRPPALGVVRRPAFGGPPSACLQEYRRLRHRRFRRVGRRRFRSPPNAGRSYRDQVAALLGTSVPSSRTHLRGLALALIDIQKRLLAPDGGIAGLSGLFGERQLPRSS